MKFPEKLAKTREAKNLTQKELAKSIGVSLRQIQYYESGVNMPSKKNLAKLVKALDTTMSFLLSEEEIFILEASDKGGSKGKKRAEEIVNETRALFAGGELSQESKDAVFQAMQEIYWESKIINKKYTPKKYLKDKGME